MASKIVIHKNECPDFKVVNLQKILVRKRASCQVLPLPVLISMDQIILFQYSLKNKRMQDEALACIIADFQSDNPGINYYKYSRVKLYLADLRFICFFNNYLMMSSLLLEKIITSTWTT